MATYNGSRFIRQQIDSILCQLAPGDEIIISDDSSTDDTVNIIKSFNDTRILLLEENRFRNPIFNFENALKHASGDVITLSDQDDIWLPGKLAEIRRLFESPPSPVYLVVMDGKVIDEQGNEIAPSIFGSMRRYGSGIVKNIFDNSYIGCSMAFSSELLEIALPFPARIPMHDIWLGILAELFGNTEFVPLKTICYRKHTDSMTSFGIRVTPWVQIKRRWFLTVELIRRRLEKI